MSIANSLDDRPFGLQLRLGVGTSQFGKWLGGRTFIQAGASVVAGVVEDAQGTHINEAMNGVPQAGFDDVPGAPDRSGFKIGPSTPTHRRSDVVDHVHSGDGSFSSNIGAGGQKEVFPRANVTFTAGTGNSPNGFDININFTTPFTYDRAAGNLLVDITTYSGALNAYVDASNVTTDGASRAFSSNINATKAASRDTGADVIRFKFH